MKKIKFALLMILSLAFQINFALTTQSINISTGVNNSNNFIGTGFPDDTWTLKLPTSSTFQPANVDGNNSTTCSKWIAPVPSFNVGGNYIYRMNFTAYGCEVHSAQIVFTYINADDALMNFGVNGNPPYTFSPMQYGINNVLNTQLIIPISPSSINAGANNTIDFTVFNYSEPPMWMNSPTGFAVCATLEIVYEDAPAPVPAFTMNSTVCAGSLISVNGSGTTGLVNNHVWTVVESDGNGNPAPLATEWWSNWSNSNPGSYTIPSPGNGGPVLTCGKYYRVKLAVQNNCGSNWVETTHVIYVNCTPTANAGPDQTICAGSCVNLSASGPIKHHTYSWVIMSDEPTLIGNGQTINVCPAQTTTYCVNVTNNLTGCTSYDCMTITVETVNPSFSASNLNTTNPSFWTVSMTPNQTTNLPSGFQHLWVVEELNASQTTTVFLTSGGSAAGPLTTCWGAVGPETFDGFNGLTNTITPCTPLNGQFKYNTYYRFTRIVQSNVCPQVYESYITRYNKSVNGSITFELDENGPDFSLLFGESSQALTTSVQSLNKDEIVLSIHPNPTNGTTTFSYAINENTSGKIVVTDLSGRVIRTEFLSTNRNTITLDLSAQENGIYFVNLFEDDQLLRTEKLILNK